ncbi:MerR-like helix-turn-helix DNA binding domain protein [Gordonia phage Finkle]|uniref:MerR-like helix-turn-helix DNA binding domain protein n=1 Tax=Gordonia phage Finkle TaxID=2926099 RepID=A0A9E7NHL3_9CAUD|nr:MerR-like helix-turn-helix DNA binding domain protein [Gordonia phage Finkle]UTN92968.1 MerR-like helix-turn-helix DNA binding domain protein [Gordonia phage Finkle]
MKTKDLEVALPPADIATLLGWKGSGTRTSPAYDTVVKACQRGELRATQRGGRKGRWHIKPSDAVAWWNGGRA